MANKNVYMIGGPNGAGKTSAAMTLLPGFLSINEFVNADNIASGLSPLNPDSMAVTAGKLMIKRIDSLIKEGKNFAFETTCAGRNHVNTLIKCKEAGYQTNLIFLWLPDEEIAVDRVKNRVQQGGHNIPENIIRRRYKTGLYNLVHLYIPNCDNVTIYDNAKMPLLSGQREIVAIKMDNQDIEIRNDQKWQFIQESL